MNDLELLRQTTQPLAKDSRITWIVQLHRSEERRKTCPFWEYRSRLLLSLLKQIIHRDCFRRRGLWRPCVLRVKNPKSDRHNKMHSVRRFGPSRARFPFEGEQRHAHPQGLFSARHRLGHCQVKRYFNFGRMLREGIREHPRSIASGILLPPVQPLRYLRYDLGNEVCDRKRRLLFTAHNLFPLASRGLFPSVLLRRLGRPLTGWKNPL